jgi:hypothetical protein
MVQSAVGRCLNPPIAKIRSRSPTAASANPFDGSLAGRVEKYK